MSAYHYTSANANAITDRIWLGNINAANDIAWIRSTGITHVITALEAPYLAPAGCTQYYVPAHDHPDEPLLLWFIPVCSWINQVLTEAPHHRILIHCMAGISRSATLTAAYLMLRDGLTPEQALTHIRAYRPQVSPNPGFLQQLGDWQQFTNAVIARGY